jgi:NAD+ synthase (glutamine-hydrolysing)
LKADVILFPELALTGYPPEDLLLRPGFYRHVQRAMERIAQAARGIDVVIGYPERTPRGIYNACAVLRDGSTAAGYRKQHLPNYSVFDEKRYFLAGHDPVVVDIKGVPVGLTVCEDIWMAEPAMQCVDAGARAIFNINASPFHMHKGREREETVRLRVRDAGIPVVYVNLVGGQDELVFDGGSFVVDASGVTTMRAPSFQEGLFVAELAFDGRLVSCPTGDIAPPTGDEASVYSALVLGVRDYVEKNGFNGVVLGLSGGIDSALTLAVAVDALGRERVEAVMMPSAYTREISLADAAAQARTMGVEYREISIAPAYNAVLESLRAEFAGRAPDVTEENIQARCRGMLLMAISNKKGKMVLTTGNKSEMAVGYATLYGDMAGGFDVLKDVPKTLVYRLAEYRNAISPVIPVRVIERAPSAELAPNQVDQDSLPPYPVLDAILERYVEQDRNFDEIVADGFDAATVRRVIRMVDRNEYKRRQAAPGVRITRRAFGKDRRYPITSGFFDEMEK